MLQTPPFFFCKIGLSSLSSFHADRSKMIPLLQFFFVCASVVLYFVLVLSSFVPHLSCLGRAMRRYLFMVSSLIFLPTVSRRLLLMFYLCVGSVWLFVRHCSFFQVPREGYASRLRCLGKAMLRDFFFLMVNHSARLWGKWGLFRHIFFIFHKIKLWWMYATESPHRQHTL